MTSDLTLTVRLTPRGGRDAIDGWTKDQAGRPVLKVRVASPPVDGAANTALIKLLSKSLGLPKSAITLVAGQTSRIKQLSLAGDAKALRATLASIAG